MHSERISDDLERKLSFYVSSTEREAGQQREVMTCDSDIKMVRGVSAKFDRLACAAHDLNLAVKYGIQHSDKIVTEMDGAVQHFVDHCKRTSIGRELKNRLVTSIHQSHLQVKSASNGECFEAISHSHRGLLCRRCPNCALGDFSLPTTSVPP